MKGSVAILLLCALLCGCGEQAPPQTDWVAFAARWQSTPTEERHTLVDLAAFRHKFIGQPPTLVRRVFGSPTTEGYNDFNEYRLLYVLGRHPAGDGTQHYILRFTNFAPTNDIRWVNSNVPQER